MAGKLTDGWLHLQFECRDRRRREAPQPRCQEVLPPGGDDIAGFSPDLEAGIERDFKDTAGADGHAGVANLAGRYAAAMALAQMMAPLRPY